MRVPSWWTNVVLAVLAVACGDQPLEVVPERQDPAAEGQMTRGGMIALATASSDDGLSITTDKDDYQPGDTVWFTGAGWPANDTLDILLQDEPATHEPHAWWVPVGEEGTFRDSTYVVDVGDLGVTFTLTATSRATERWLSVVFTDNLGNIQMTSATPTPFSPNQASSAGIRDLNTISLQNGGGAANGVTVRIRAGEPGPTPSSQTLVRTLGPINVASNAAASLNWDGKNTGGTHVADGVYTARVVGSNENNGDNDKRRIVVDNANPTVAVDAIAGGTTGDEMTITGTTSDLPAVTGAGLEKVEVTVRRSSDNVVLASGLATNTGTNFDTWSFDYTPTEASAQKANAKATDNAGNNTTSADRAFTVVSPDQAAPTINCSAPNPAPWYGDNVVVPCTASDAGSGLANPADGSFTLSTNVGPNVENPSAATGSRQVCDNLNNCATAGPFTFKVDRKAPAISCGAADGNWHATDVSIACIATDGGSGLATVGDANFNLVTNVAANTENANASTNSRAVLDDVGNSATAGPVSGNKIDKKAPTISCDSPDGEWHDADVSIACTASDNGSGLKNTVDASFTLVTSVAPNTETANAMTGSRNVLDDVDNSATAGPVGGNKVDKKAPVVSCGTADGNWHADDVQIACSASDGGSGLANPANASFHLVTNVAANTETANASTDSRNVLDNVGHSSAAGPITGNKVDKKAPAVSCGAADGNWHASNVSIPCTGTDGGSGLADAGDANFALVTSVADNTETDNASTDDRDVLDGVGNSTTAGPVTGNKIDRKAPAVACGAADGNWHASDVSIGCTATDGGSGLDDPADGAFDLVTSVAPGNETSNASTNSRSVLDDVGNSATAGPVTGNKIDKKGPVVTLTCPASPVLLNAPVSASWTATDGGSGVANGYAAGSFGVPSSPVGQKTATAAQGVSHDNVNNPSSPSAPCGYNVEFVFSGFRTPVDNNGVLNGANSGQAIPLKWELRDYAGNPVTTLTSVNVTVVTLACNAGSTADQIEEYAANASGLLNQGGGSYQFNWKTPTSYARSCKTMKLDLGEGTVRTAMFEFRK